jgi:hypothetical protein
MSTQIPSAGDRISVSGAYGTVLYVGGVQGTKGPGSESIGTMEREANTMDLRME